MIINLRKGLESENNHLIRTPRDKKAMCLLKTHRKLSLAFCGLSMINIKAQQNQLIQDIKSPNLPSKKT